VNCDLPSVARAEAFHVCVPFRRPFATARGIVTVRSSWILRLCDSEGRTGLGEIALDPCASSTEESRLAGVLREALGIVAAGRLPHWNHPTDAGPESRAVRAGLDEAVEALGRAALAVAPDPRRAASVAVNATLDVVDPRGAATAAARAAADGFRCIKLKVGPEPVAPLVDRVAAVRAAVGASVGLRLDANCSWGLAMAVERLDALTAFEIEYVEQPLALADLDGHARLRRESPIPIALDESVYSDAAAAAILSADAADVLVVKPARVGGPAVVREIAARAAAAGVPLVLSTFFETGVGTDAAVRAAAGLPRVGPERAHGLGTAGLLVHDLLQVPTPVVGGRIALREIALVDEAALKRYTVEQMGPNP
jgi:o-succinylbenzoate synthase